MVKTIKWILKAMVAGIMTIGILSAFTMVYSHSGVHVGNETGATDYKWEPNQFKSSMEEGFAWLRMNGDGFNNSFCLSTTECMDILLMGSSHMEAVNVPDDKNVGYILNQMLPDKTTYNIGMSGHTIYHCARNLKDAVTHYNPRGFVIIETDKVSLDKDMMQRVLDNELPVIKSHDKGMMYMIQKYIPCIQPFYRELGNWISAGKRVYASSNSKECTDTDEYGSMLNSFIGSIKNSAQGRKVIIVFHPKTELAENGRLKEEELRSVEEFRSACAKNGVVFVDMYDDFSREYESSHELAHGFANSAVGAGHMNETGHRLMAERLTMVVRDLENGIE